MRSPLDKPYARTQSLPAVRSAGTALPSSSRSLARFPSRPLSEFTYRSYATAPQVIYTTSVIEANEALGRLRGRVLGFDMEWPYDREAPEGEGDGRVALIQVCDLEMIILYHMKDENAALPSKLIEILQDDTIYKTGVQCRGDGKKLLADFPSSFPSGLKALLELTNLARRVDHRCGPGNTLKPLKELCKVYLGRRLDKDQEVRASDWSKELDEEQKEYAANDAYAGLQIYLALHRLSHEREVLEITDRVLDSCSNTILPDGRHYRGRLSRSTVVRSDGGRGGDGGDEPPRGGGSVVPYPMGPVVMPLPNVPAIIPLEEGKRERKRLVDLSGSDTDGEEKEGERNLKRKKVEDDRSDSGEDAGSKAKLSTEIGVAPVTSGAGAADRPPVGSLKAKLTEEDLQAAVEILLLNEEDWAGDF